MGWRGSGGVAALLGFIALLALTWVASARSDGGVPALDLWVAGLAVTAALIGWALRKIPSTRPSMALAWVCTLLLSVLVTTRTTPEGRVTFAVFFVVLGVLLAGILSGVLLAIHVVVLAMVMIFALDAKPHLLTVEVGLSLTAAMVVLVTLVHLVVRRHDTLVRELRDAALRDPLTGALNRRGAALEASAVHAVAERLAVRQSTVVAFDIDSFKAYNDSHGHAVGDQLLVALVRSWRTKLRASDILARMGGDEFAAVLVGADLAQSVRVIDRLADHTPTPWSFGMVEWHPGETFDHALDRADRELYARKRERAGRTGSHL